MDKKKEMQLKVLSILFLAIVLLGIAVLVRPCWFYNFQGNLFYCHNGNFYFAP